MNDVASAVMIDAALLARAVSASCSAYFWRKKLSSQVKRSASKLRRHLTAPSERGIERNEATTRAVQ